MTCFVDVQPSLVDVFSAVSEGRLSPLDAAQTVEEALFTMPILEGTSLPKIIKGEGKSAQWIGKKIEELQKEQGRVLVTDIEPIDYAEIRKLAPGVQYHAGAKTLKIGNFDSLRKLPGTVAIASDITVPNSVIEELKTICSFLGCYAFELPPLTITRVTDIIQHTKSFVNSSVILVAVDEEPTLADVIGGLTDAPIISVFAGKLLSQQPSALSTRSLSSAAMTVAKILMIAERITTLQKASERFEEVETSLQEARELLELTETASSTQSRRNNVVSNVKEVAEQRSE